jgi:hypothetical protein
MCLPFGQRSTVETGRIAGERLERELEKGVLSGHHRPVDGARLRALVRQLAQDLLEFGVGDAGPCRVEDGGVVGGHQVSNVNPAAGGEVPSNGYVPGPVLVTELKVPERLRWQQMVESQLHVQDLATVGHEPEVVQDPPVRPELGQQLHRNCVVRPGQCGHRDVEVLHVVYPPVWRKFHGGGVDGAEWKIRVTPCYRKTVRRFSVYVSMIFYRFAVVF